MAAQWQANLGLAVELRPMTYEAFKEQATRQSGFDGAFRMSWSTTYPSADDWMAPLFATSGIGRTNLERYSNAAFDHDLDKRARQAGDATDQRLEYQHLEDRLCRDLPLLPVTFDTVSYRVDPRLAVAGHGSPIDSTTGEPRLHDLYIR